MDRKAEFQRLQLPKGPRPCIMRRMKRFFALLLVLFFASLAGALAQGLDDEYVQIFKLIQEADTLSNTAPSQALAKYLDAQTALDRLHKGSPDWNTRIVDYRLSYLAERIAALSATSSPAPAVPANNTKSPGTAPAAPSPGQPVPTADWKSQVDGLQQQVGQLRSEKGLLEAKLKEALALRPASADPGELTKAQDTIKALQKENELLKVNAEREKQTPGTAVDSKALEGAQRQLADANRQLADQSARLSKVTLEKEALETRLKNSSTDSGVVASLRVENDLLKKQLAVREAAPPTVAKTTDNGRQSTEAQSQIAKLQSDKESLRIENMALENRLKQLSGPVPANNGASATVAATESVRIKQLEDQRDELQKQLDTLVKEKSGRKTKGNARTQELENELLMARTRLEVFEARAVPYSPEELDLLKRPQAKLAEADPKAGKKSIKELPPGAAALVAEAQRCFAAKQFDKAEAAYLQVLQQDPKNVPTLANLAAIQVEEEHFDRAESNIKQALAQDPEDAYSLYILGILRFRQAKYDDALDALSHSAKLDPQNPEVQNYLGLALSEKGMRGPAEAALRKAVQLKPDYAGAHYNLAVVYATEQPPAPELARWHYQKAVAAGHPRNQDLEKRFEVRQ
jgi:Flp pilus assembly protein TadD